MNSLESVFATRLVDPQNQRMIENLSLVVASHDERPVVIRGMSRSAAQALVAISGNETSASIDVARGIEELASYHSVTVDQLRDFAVGKQVVDVGAGKSSFLDAFKGIASETTAVDIKEDFVEHQKAKGHRAIFSYAHMLHRLDTGSVGLLHASYSVPFWETSPQLASRAADEYIRVLAPGGIALVGPFAHTDSHPQYEAVVSSKRYSGRQLLPWSLEQDHGPYQSRVIMAFAGNVLTQELLQEVDIVGTRTMTSTFHADRVRHMQPDVHVPNFLMIRRR